ncbi:helix-turn-helix domain-containing protein [Aureimonas altamirensis]|uniref:helix-turn-helix domain-containing protein n=1 Tax=Aureimonas altamirensis TaxID=370622 RepID=UPI003018B4BF
MDRRESSYRKLTPREKEVLIWASQGKTAWETSVILSISKNTVITHLRNARYKLNAANGAHAITKAALRQDIMLSHLDK